MVDNKGVNIKTGDIVEIKGSYFKSDNGLYFVEHSAGDPDWCGDDHCLMKISKKGKISNAKYNLCFWPIMITTNNRTKRIEARNWNNQYAEIHVKHGICQDEVAERFRAEAEQMGVQIKYDKYNYGEDSSIVKDKIEVCDFYKKVVARIRTEA